MARPERVRLGDLLIQEGLLTSEQLTQALEEQRRTGRKLGRMIVDNGLVTEEQVSQALAKQLRMPFMDVGGRTLRPELVKLLPEVQARRLRSAVLEDTGASYKVMMADPTDINAYDELGRLLKRDIVSGGGHRDQAAGRHRPQLPTHRPNRWSGQRADE